MSAPPHSLRGTPNMKVSCLQENLARGLNIVSRAVAPRSATLPVLTHVLVATDNGRLRIAATNLELGIGCWIGAKVDEDGAITVPARTLSDLVNLLSAGQLDLEGNTRAQSLHVQSGRTDANIKGIDAAEFPIIPSFNAEGSVQVDPKTLKKLIDQVAFAASTDDSRPAMTGVFTRLDGDTITMAATDGFRLSVCSGRLIEPVTEARSVLIPARAIAEVGRIIGDQQDPIAISITPSHGQVLFHLKDVDVVAQLIDQKFPNYEFIIPKKYETRAVVNTAELLKACKQASIFARDSADIVRLTISAGEAPEVAVAARADETGEDISRLGKEDGVAEASGPTLEIGFNVRYLIDALGAMDKPQVAIEASSPRSAGVIRPIGDDAFLHVLMPINLPRL